MLAYRNLAQIKAATETHHRQTVPTAMRMQSFTISSGLFCFLVLQDRQLLHQRRIYALWGKWIKNSKRGCSKIQPPKKRKSLGAVAVKTAKNSRQGFPFVVKLRCETNYRYWLTHIFPGCATVNWWKLRRKNNPCQRQRAALRWNCGGDGLKNCQSSVLYPGFIPVHPFHNRVLWRQGKRGWRMHSR